MVCFCVLNLEKFSLDAEVCKLLDLRVDSLGVLVQDIVVFLMLNGSVVLSFAVIVAVLSGVFVEVLESVVGGLSLTLVLGDRGELHLKVDEDDEVEGEE